MAVTSLGGSEGWWLQGEARGGSRSRMRACLLRAAALVCCLAALLPFIISPLFVYFAAFLAIPLGI